MSQNVHPVFRSILEATAPTPRPVMVDAGVVRNAILDVMDSGWKCAPHCDVAHGWRFHPEDPGDDETEHRMRFLDAVENRIRELQSAPHNLGIKLENYCPAHLGIRLGLPEPTVTECVDCKARRLAQ